MLRTEVGAMAAKAQGTRNLQGKEMGVVLEFLPPEVGD